MTEKTRPTIENVITAACYCGENASFSSDKILMLLRSDIGRHTFIEGVRRAEIKNKCMKKYGRTVTADAIHDACVSAYWDQDESIKAVKLLSDSSQESRKKNHEDFLNRVIDTLSEYELMQCDGLSRRAKIIFALLLHWNWRVDDGDDWKHYHSHPISIDDWARKIGGSNPLISAAFRELQIKNLVRRTRTSKIKPYSTFIIGADNE